MNCEYYRELISARQDDELPDDEEHQLLEHLAYCEACRKYAGEIEELSEIVSSWQGESLPEAKEKAIVEKAMSRIGKRRAPQFLKGYYRIPRGVAWSAMAIMVFLLIEYMGNLPGNGSETITPENQTKIEGVTQKIILTEHDVVSQYTINGRSNN